MSILTGAFLSRRGRRPENASVGPVSLPEYAPSVKDDRSGWKGEPPMKKGKMPSAASLFFFVRPFEERPNRWRPRPLKGEFRGVRAEERTYPFRPAAKGVPDCPGIKKVPHPVRAGYGTFSFQIGQVKGFPQITSVDSERIRIWISRPYPASLYSVDVFRFIKKGK